jgi:hypothetical protein
MELVLIRISLRFTERRDKSQDEEVPRVEVNEEEHEEGDGEEGKEVEEEEKTVQNEEENIGGEE